MTSQRSTSLTLEERFKPILESATRSNGMAKPATLTLRRVPRPEGRPERVLAGLLRVADGGRLNGLTASSHVELLIRQAARREERATESTQEWALEAADPAMLANTRRLFLPKHVVEVDRFALPAPLRWEKNVRGRNLARIYASRGVLTLG